MGVSTLPFSFLSPTENFKPISACHLLLSCSLIFTNAEKDKSERSEEDELFTVGGLVYSKINRIPNNNEIIKTDDNLEIKILKSNNRKIETVEIKKIN